MIRDPTIAQKPKVFEITDIGPLFEINNSHYTDATAKTLDSNYRKKLEKEAKSLAKGKKGKGKKGNEGESSLRGANAKQIDESLETIPLLTDVADTLLVFLDDVKAYLTSF